MKSLSISQEEKYNIIQSLGTFLGSGIPILEAVESLLEESNGNSTKILKILKEDLKQGKKISYSLSRHPKSFDPITVNLINAAEEAGTLEQTLKDLTISIQKNIEFSGKVRGSLVYPMVVLVIMFGVIILNLFFVIPSFIKVFTRINVELPLITRMLFSISNIVNENILLTIFGFILFIALIYIAYKSYKSFLSRILFSLPIISKLIIEIDLTRFNRSMSLMLKSGIPIDEAIELSRDVVIKKDVRKAIDHALKDVINGKKFGQSFKSYRKVIPGFMVRIIEAGEKSGTLDNSMRQLSDQLDIRVTNRLRTLTLLIEPILLLIVGIMVLGVILAIIVPIYSSLGNLNTR